MSALSSVKPQPWPLSPALTEAPDLWRECKFLMAAWESVGAPFDLVSRKLPDVTDFDGWVVGKDGVAVDFEATTLKKKKLAWSNRSDIPSGNAGEGITFACRVFLESNDDNRSIVEFITESRSEGWIIRVENGGVFFRTFGGNNGGDGSSLSPGSTFDIVCTWVGNGESKTYVDGVNTDTTVISDTSSGADLLNLGAFNDDGNSGNMWDGTLVWVGIWNRILDENEVKYLHNDPFAMLRPRSDL